MKFNIAQLPRLEREELISLNDDGIEQFEQNVGLDCHRLQFYKTNGIKGKFDMFGDGLLDNIVPNIPDCLKEKTWFRSVEQLPDLDELVIPKAKSIIVR